MLPQRFYYIEDIASLLGKSVSAIYGHLSRKQYDAVPPPMKLGRRLVWLVETTEEWINAKVICAKAEIYKQMQEIHTAPKRRGRPSKAEMRKNENTEIILKILSKNSPKEANNEKPE
ncbi:MAG: hypothetical protein LBU53_09940 [Zoogloeaceae bacterium]|nr:hypothetical protein [Zoogloeaceae bacterium]